MISLAIQLNSLEEVINAQCILYSLGFTKGVFCTRNVYECNSAIVGINLGTKIFGLYDRVKGAIDIPSSVLEMNPEAERIKAKYLAEKEHRESMKKHTLFLDRTYTTISSSDSTSLFHYVTSTNH
jgi:hypothetical protein